MLLKIDPVKLFKKERKKEWNKESDVVTTERLSICSCYLACPVQSTHFLSQAWLLVLLQFCTLPPVGDALVHCPDLLPGLEVWLADGQG